MYVWSFSAPNFKICPSINNPPEKFRLNNEHTITYVCIFHRYLKAPGLLTESSEPSREGEVVKAEESAHLMRVHLQGQVGKVVVGVVGKYQLNKQFKWDIRISQELICKHIKLGKVAQMKIRKKSGRLPNQKLTPSCFVENCIFNGRNEFYAWSHFKNK